MGGDSSDGVPGRAGGGWSGGVPGRAYGGTLSSGTSSSGTSSSGTLNSGTMSSGTSSSGTLNSGTRPRYLVLRLHALGDVALATGIVEALARSGIEVAVATEERFLPVFHGLPSAPRLWTRAQIEEAASTGVPRASRTYDRVIDLQGSPGSRRLAARLGPASTVRSRSALRRFVVFWGDRFPRPCVPHVLSRYAEAAGLDPATARAACRPVLRATSLDEEEARRLAPEAFATPAKTAVLLLTGASRRTKEYPPERFRDVARGLERAGLSVWRIAPPGDDAAGVTPMPRATGPLFRLPLGALKAVLARAALAVSNDSGPMHIATGLGVPVVALFGSSVERFGFFPTGEHVRVLEAESLACRPCGVHGRNRCWLGHKRCLLDIEPARVVEAARELLAESRPVRAAGDERR